MKKIVLILAAFVLAAFSFSTSASAQALPGLLPGATPCVGDGHPGTNQITFFVSSTFHVAPACQTINVGTLSDYYIVNDLSAYGWNGPSYDIGAIWTGPGAYADMYRATNLVGGFSHYVPNEKQGGATGVHYASLRAWHF